MLSYYDVVHLRIEPSRPRNLVFLFAAWASRPAEAFQLGSGTAVPTPRAGMKEGNVIV